MTTQIIFKIDSKLKKAAQAKAKAAGISLSQIYKSATKSFVEGKFDVGLIYYGTLTPNAKTGKELLQARKDLEQGKNMSPVFTNMKEMDKYLDNLK